MNPVSSTSRDKRLKAAQENRIRYECAGATAQGFGRKLNQDRYRVSDGGVVLCDGIGGAKAGEVFAEASCWSCDSLMNRELPADEIIDDANIKVSAVGKALGSTGGSSVCIAKFCQDGSIDISSRGDVLAFRVRADDIAAINMPDYSADKRLRSFLGDRRRGVLASQRYCATPLAAGRECLMLLSDGIWKSLSPSEIAKAWQSSEGNVEKTASKLVMLAGRYGSLDDRTAVVCARVA